MNQFYILRSGLPVFEYGELSDNASIDDVYAHLSKKKRRNIDGSCNSILLQTESKSKPGKYYNFLIDPGYKKHKRELLRALEKIRNPNIKDKKVGLTPKDIDLVICTHNHPDHAQMAPFFGKEKMLLGMEHTSERLEQLKNMDDAEGSGPLVGYLLREEQIILFPTPGHTQDHMSVATWNTPFGVVIIAGDAIVSPSYFDHNTVYKRNLNFFSEEDALKSMQIIKDIAHYVIPGHGNSIQIKKRGDKIISDEQLFESIVSRRGSMMRERDYPLYEDVLKRTGLKIPEIKSSSKICDVGCGYGRALRDLAEMIGPTGLLSGVDIDNISLEKAAQSVNEFRQLPARVLSFDNKDLQSHKKVKEIFQTTKSSEELYVLLYHTSADKMPLYKNNYFDYIFSIISLPYMYKQAESLIEMLRILKRGGELYVAQSNYIYVLDRPLTPEENMGARQQFEKKASIQDVSENIGVTFSRYFAYDFLEEFFPKNALDITKSSKSRFSFVVEKKKGFDVPQILKKINYEFFTYSEDFAKLNAFYSLSKSK
ncbi:methyltransferase domain-containing protein [Candidatus Undinarchaeota archaeon]